MLNTLSGLYCVTHATTFPALLTVITLRKLGLDATTEQVRDYLAKLSGFADINGVYDFPKPLKRRLDDFKEVVTRWDKAASTWRIVSHPRGIPLD